MPDGALQVEANLGAHSPTNFYKGLSGNDVVDDGGLFVATYDIPPLGSKLWVSVNMPGGYEFQGVAEVRWVRETGAGDAPPGFGCAFRDITKEARQLIYRYVRNREPLFHDDL
jgi:Tfp pilus assembly protein PilZ